ncbi:putative lipoprotein [Aliivibrio wodanis]|uniref:Putative lipoprotein n=1 Tax=Aliivibrio wodanis TaxID=80852 RepID=A0A090KJR8_9GAMM|nr:putative lipoprotein [Aliivibrio wodanis]
MKNTSKSLIIILWIISLFITFLIGCILSGFLTTSEIDTKSTSFGNWAMWVGSFFGGVASFGALFAANFTRKTLSFLTKQHDDQQALQKIQMFQAHKDAFYSLLDEIEANHKHIFKIERRNILYQNIFPDNNFQYTYHKATTIEITDVREQTSGLNEIIRLHYFFNNQQESTNHCDSRAKTLYLINITYMLTEQLHMTFIDRDRVADIKINQNNAFLNAFDSITTYHSIGSTFHSILRFTGNQDLIDNLPNIYLRNEEIFNFFLPKYGNTNFNIDFKEHLKDIDHLWAFHQTLQSKSLNKFSLKRELSTKLFTIFSTYEGIDLLFKNKIYQKDFYKEIVHSVETIFEHKYLNLSDFHSSRLTESRRYFLHALVKIESSIKTEIIN